MKFLKGKKMHWKRQRKILISSFRGCLFPNKIYLFQLSGLGEIISAVRSYWAKSLSRHAQSKRSGLQRALSKSRGRYQPRCLVSRTHAPLKCGNWEIKGALAKTQAELRASCSIPAVRGSWQSEQKENVGYNSPFCIHRTLPRGQELLFYEFLPIGNWEAGTTVFSHSCFADGETEARG